MVVLRDLVDEIALVTGATGGIGRATCLALANYGCGIAIHYNSDEEGAKKLLEEVGLKSVRARIFQADLSNYDDVRRLHEEVVRGMGRPTILFNNAGATVKSNIKSLDEVSIEDFEKTWRLNTGSAYLLTQLCIPDMEKKKFGRVIFCSSVAAFTGGVVGPHYASSKSALHGLTHWISKNYCKNGITANAVAPALIEDTKLFPGDNKEVVSASVPGRPEEVAETVVWMVRVGYVTNKVVGVDGGMYAQG